MSIPKSLALVALVVLFAGLGLTEAPPVEGQGPKVAKIVLKVEPMHPGAHHYRIHLWDGSKPERALPSAALFGKSAAGIAHAWHMPGHTYTGLKRYADAAYQQEASARVDHADMALHRIMPFPTRLSPARRPGWSSPGGCCWAHSATRDMRFR